MALSPALRRFVIGNLPSVGHLEALLLLRAEGRAWLLEQLGARLYLPTVDVMRLVDDLQARGLVERSEGTVRFAPGDATMAAVVDELAACYARHLVQITKLIHSLHDGKAARFADAFYVRKGER